MDGELAYQIAGRKNKGRVKMISINVTFFIQMANFLILLFLMNLFLYRPIRRIVAQRNQFVAEQQQGIDQAEAEVAVAIEKFNTSINEARKKGRAQIQEIKSSAYEQEKALMQDATEKAAKQVQVTRMEIQTDIKKARKQLKGQVKTLSAELAQKILGRNI
jgi:F-type H+-transporting ATPase subunit b